jgi:predicted enzyme related to lactoylglutathione lyase
VPVSGGAVQLQAIVLDAARPAELARFYAQLLDRPIVRVDGGWHDIDLAGGLTLSIQHAPDHRPPTWPEWDVPQQLHLDLVVDDLDAAERRALEAGARRARQPADADGRFRVMIDPAGHPFCLCAR